MALGAVAGGEGDAEPRPVGDVRVAEGVGVFAAGAVAVFALNVGQILESRRHRRPVAVGQHRRKDPAELGGDIVEAAVDCVGVRIVTDNVAGDAAAAEVAGRRICSAVNFPGEGGRVTSLGPRFVDVLEDAAAMAEGAGADAQIGASADGHGQVRGTGGSDDPGKNGVLTGDIRNQHGTTSHLGNWGAAVVVAVGHLVGGNRGAQRAWLHVGHGADGLVGQNKGDTDDVRRIDGRIDQCVEIGRLADAHSGQTARALRVRERVILLFLRR